MKTKKPENDALPTLSTRWEDKQTQTMKEAGMNLFLSLTKHTTEADNEEPKKEECLETSMKTKHKSCLISLTMSAEA